MRYDIVLWGATGFTGALVAEYLARHEGVGRGTRWAIAGRSEAKLREVRARLVAIDPAAEAIPMLVADAGDPASLAALARQARVVCTTVGPYSRYGSALVAACVAEGAHYCDLTGEAHWMRAMIEAHDDEARRQRVRIVHACGFDSLPSDLGCFVAEERAIATLGRPLPRVTLYVRTLRGEASGGTIASMGAVLEAVSTDRAARRAIADPYSLLPADAPRGPHVRDFRPVAWDADEGLWTAPYFMASVNAKVVRRTNALLGGRYGDGFRYEERSAYRAGPKGLWRATGMSAGLAVASGALAIRPLRRLLLDRVLPSPGEGPAAEARAAGRFVVDVVARDDRDRIVVRVTGDQDPGYGATAGMLAEAALSLAHDELPDRYGVVTPAAAMGKRLVDRLPRAGVRFEG